ncbi:hypothetical protein SBOR_6851 [Sclerotinia borealis F-4128]|uniref:Uncharacterized protein n=1 Tax=Sclerotinia borealis (strain F-4128) TaxID=1432307 RepID=W9CD45_SCLBF|nr:hypothetical protein SBOR_6851 [Sclerotinia borealis F-4128]
MSTEPLNFDAITNEERSLFDNDDLDIVDLFQTAIKSSSTFDIDKKAERFVTDLVVYATEKQWVLNTVYFQWRTWNILIYIAIAIPYKHYAQDVLFKVIVLLEEDVDKSWEGFGPVIRSLWNCSPKFTSTLDDDDENLSLDEWLNLNSFVAKISNDGDEGSLIFGVWGLRSGLEEDLHKFEDDGKPSPQSFSVNRVRVACEWIIQAGPAFFKQSLLNVSFEEIPAKTGRPYCGGALFLGTNGFTIEHWGFWKRRFIEVRKDFESESVCAYIDKALRVMSELEGKAANAIDIFF